MVHFKCGLRNHGDSWGSVAFSEIVYPTLDSEIFALREGDKIQKMIMRFP